METLNSLTDALNIIKSNCSECNDSFGDDYKVLPITRTNGIVMFDCERGMHPQKYNVNFVLHESDFKTLEDEFEDLNIAIKNMYNSDLHQIPRVLISQTEKIFRKSRLYSLFSPENKEVKIKGMCGFCLSPSNLTFRDYKLWTGCSDCASILADGID